MRWFSYQIWVFNRFHINDKESCPVSLYCRFRANVLKIRKIKEIIIIIWLNPGLQEELADEIGLNLKKLKMGFKQIYGDTVYGFLFDYKMDFA
jgi:hypothetical protein